MLQKLGVNIWLLPDAICRRLDDIDLIYKTVAGEEAVLLSVWLGIPEENAAPSEPGACFRATTYNRLLLVERLKEMLGEEFDVRVEHNTVCVDWRPV